MLRTLKAIINEIISSTLKILFLNVTQKSIRPIVVLTLRNKLLIEKWFKENIKNGE